MIVYIFLSVVIFIGLLFAYSCLKVSSECSRQEEREEIYGNNRNMES